MLTKDQQSQLTPDQVIKVFKKGNEDFVNNELTVRNNPHLVCNTSAGQYPMAVVLSCLDSRVPVEDIFHRCIGEIFVARVAGNIVNTDILGSMEFACKVSGAKLVMVMGHSACGAVQSAIDNVELGNITELLNKIKPAIEKTKLNFFGKTNSSNAAFVEEVCHNNIILMMNEIRKKSPILKEMEVAGIIKIIGAYYNLETGEVEIIECHPEHSEGSVN